MSHNQNKPKEFKSFFQKTGLVVDRTYTRQKIRIAMCKIWPSHTVKEKFAALWGFGYIEFANKNALSENLDTFTIKKDFLNG